MERRLTTCCNGPLASLVAAEHAIQLYGAAKVAKEREGMKA